MSTEEHIRKNLLYNWPISTFEYLFWASDGFVMLSCKYFSVQQRSPEPSKLILM